MRRAVTMLALVIVGAIVVPVAGPLPGDTAAAPPTSFANPPIDDRTADPFVLEWGQRSYAYVAGENLPAYVSGDLAAWDAVGDVLPDERFGAWMAPAPAGGGITAPAVAVYPDNPAGARFVLWFTATDARSGQRCVGVATAGAPTGPFDAADEPLLCPPGGARDPSPMASAGRGPAQLVFRQEGDRPGIYAQQLAPDGTAAAATPPTPLLLDSATDGQAARPSLVRTSEDQAALFFTSTTSTTSPAEGAPRSIGWARCTLGSPPDLSLAGPGDGAGDGSGRGGGTFVTSCTAVPGGRQWVVGNEDVESPGAPQVFGEATDRWIVYDAYEPSACATGTCTGERRMHIDKLCFDATPTATSTATHARPASAARVPGDPGAGATLAAASDGVAGELGAGPAHAATTDRMAGEPGAGATRVDVSDRLAGGAGVGAALADASDGLAGGPGVGAAGADAGGGGGERPRTGAPRVGRQELGRKAACRSDVAAGWVATWAAGMMPATSQFRALASGFADQTLRQMVHTSVGGAAVRVRLSNTFGTAPLRIGRAAVGLATEPAGSAAAVEPASQRPLTFGGSTAVVVPPGGDVVSDAVALDVPPDHDLAVSVWFPEPTGPPSAHLVALETSYVGAGDLVDDPGPGFIGAGAGAAATTTTAGFFVSAVDVLVDEPRGTVVLLGDSLTDGAGSLTDAEQRWSDLVVDQLVAGGPAGLGIVNVGIAGNPLLPDDRSTSPSALERFDHDVLSQADVGTVVVLLGTNDLLGHLSIGPAVVEGLQQLVDRAHAAGVRVVGVTIPPLAGPIGAPTPAAVEQARTDVNARIRGESAGDLGYDAVVDMDAALHDPLNPHRLRIDYAWFGGLHPNALGHRAMAAAVDLSQLAPASAPG